MKTYKVTVNGQAYTSTASRPMVAVKRVVQAEDKRTKGHPFRHEAAGLALHIYVEVTP